MPPTFTLFRLSLRSILRERVAGSMLGLLLLVLLLLPAGLETDGTLEGAVRMQIRYSLGFSFVLLAGMTLWASCASVAGDLSSKRLQMVLTKPVSRAAVWWGKWLAVVTLVTALGMLCGGVTWFRVIRLAAGSGLTGEAREQVFSQIITARRAVDTPVRDFGPEAERVYSQQLEAGAIPQNAPREQILERIEHTLQVEAYAAGPGDAASWNFPLRQPLQSGEELQLFFQVQLSGPGGGSVPGEWRISGPDEDPALSFPVENLPRGSNVIPFSVPAGLVGADRLEVTFVNLAEERAKIFFQPNRGVRLFRTGGTFGPNLFRAVLLLSGLLAILAAIGVTTGSVFSLPVACYTASVTLLLQAFSGVVSEVVSRGLPPDLAEAPWILQRLTELRLAVFQLILRLLQPLQVGNPLSRVAEGVLIPYSEVGSVLLFRFTPVILLAAAIGIFLFSRREIGGAS
jgi:ABC-type transport system involved in multi-copper enzyme maturation permease subunit